MIYDLTLKGKRPHECYACGSKHSAVDRRHGIEVWFLNWDKEENSLCKNCFRRHIQPDQTFRRRIKQNGIVRLVDKPPRSGYCSKCSNNTFDGSCKRTALHSTGEEFCWTCYNKIKWKEGIIIPKKTGPRGPRSKTTDEHRANLSKAMKGKTFSTIHKERIKEARSRQTIPVRDTSIEKTIQNELMKMGIKFETHKMFRIRNFIHPVDIFVKPNICIECDGEYWHTRLVAHGTTPILRDNIIDLELERLGMNVIRLWEYDIKNHLNWCIQRIYRII